MALAQIIIIALIIVVIVGGTILFLVGQESEKKKRAMSLVTGQSDFKSEKGNSAKNAQNKRRAEIAKKLKQSKEEEEKDDPNKKPTMALQLERAGLSISVTQFWLFSLLSMGLTVMLAKVFGMSTFVTVMAAVIGLFGLPRFVLKRMRDKRQKKFLTEFPDALEASVRLLKAGMPVSEAIKMVSREFDGPVGEEMTRIYDKQKIGVPLHEAAYEATYRMPLPEMQMFATGLAIQAQTGSSLSDVLMNLAGVIRARFRLKRKVKALSSEAIASASIIAALPVLVCMGLYFGNPDYIGILFTNPTGKLFLGGAVAWMCVGVFVMKIMINFKI